MAPVSPSANGVHPNFRGCLMNTGVGFYVPLCFTSPNYLLGIFHLQQIWLSVMWNPQIGTSIPPPATCWTCSKIQSEDWWMVRTVDSSAWFPPEIAPRIPTSIVSNWDRSTHPKSIINIHKLSKHMLIWIFGSSLRFQPSGINLTIGLVIWGPQALGIEHHASMSNHPQEIIAPNIDKPMLPFDTLAPMNMDGKKTPARNDFPDSVQTRRV